VACYERHGKRDPLIGVPLCAVCYDYAGAVLWNAGVGRLWDRAVNYTARELAKRSGIRVRDLKHHARISFAKVVEYQHRGSMHLHAVIRVDGPGGPDDPAPSWASAALLGEAVTAAVASVRVRVPEPVGSGERVLCFGPQLDVQEIRTGTGLDGLSDTAVAAYVAKYVTKGDISSLVLPTRLRSEGQIDVTPGLSGHGRALMHTAWTLGGLPRFEYLKLRTWAHQAGFRGHILSKSLRYSTTYTVLRSARSAFHRPEELDGVETVTESSWRLDHIGHTPGQALFAYGMAAKLQDARDASNERARAERRAGLVGGEVSAAAGRLPDADRDQTRVPRGQVGSGEQRWGA
jgi:hypothetical protein